MRPQFQFARGGAVRSAIACSALAGFLLAALLICPAIARADDAPGGAVARIEGRDISVEGGVAGSSQPNTAPSIYASNGSVVTVHSGKARMTLFTGGKVEICGPAKFTVLLSGDAITLALNFGRVRVELPAKTTLRIFTPTIIGTPIDISGGSRDVTVGLDLDDSLCVLATSGAIQLEHQFTGDKVIVPQAGEFFLNSGKLLPVAGTPGSCQCLADEPSAPPPAPVIPEFATAAPSQAAPDRASAAAARAEQATESEPSIEYAVLEHANQGHPIVASAKAEATAAPPVSAPSESVVMPALVFTAGTPLPPPGPSQDVLMLIGEARVSPEWEFSGRVEPPEFAKAVQQALGENVVAPQQQEASAAQPTEKPKKKKGGFWAALKRVFRGSAED